MKTLKSVGFVLLLVGLLVAACAPAAPTEAPAATAMEPTAVPPTAAPAWTAPEGALAALPVDASPTLDGVGDEAVWAQAAAVTIPVAGGYNGFQTEATLKAVYTADSVYFLLSYADPTESWYRAPWQKQEDGTWKRIGDPNDKGGDNNLYYEDKFAFIWPIADSVPNFATAGCFTACHAGENPDLKPYGNKYTANEGELADIWHWKSVRNLNQVDDQYLDSTRFNAETAKEAGRKSDAKESGGYADNFGTMPDPADATKTVPDKSVPGFTSPSVDTATGAPGYILDSEKVALDAAALEAMPVGTLLPGIIKSEIVGDRGQIAAGWVWADGVWTIEFGRALVTGSETDVQFDDVAGGSYSFGLAIFENAQVRHAFQSGAAMLVFQPR
jgi:hypothetical protein